MIDAAFGDDRQDACVAPWRGLAAALALGLLLAPAARAEDGSADSTGGLEEFSLEDLLEINFNVLGVTGIHHTHRAGEIMIGFSSMFMHMDGNRSGTSSRSRSDVLADYMVSPTDMDMSMTMTHLMWAPTDRITLMAMLPYVRKSMHHVTRAGGSFTTDTDGLGDIRVDALVSVTRGGSQRLILTTGLSIPSGSIDEKGETPMGRTRLPYPMQLGSGTVDLIPGVTYLGQHESWAWGLRAEGTIRLHENENNYRLGDRARVSIWGANRLLSWLSASLRLDGQYWGNIHGADPKLNPAMVSTADPDRRRGQRIDFLAGVNVFRTEGWFAGHRLSLEGGVPVYQWLDGPQLETDWLLSAGWEWTF